MRANELRIGNLVQHKHGGKVIEAVVSPLDAPRFWESIEGTYEPIPLTKEWLVKFDDLVETDHSIKKFDVPAYNNRSHDIFLEYHLRGWYMRTPHVIREIQHVHQLQNLYFALTGEELTIKDS